MDKFNLRPRDVNLYGEDICPNSYVFNYNLEQYDLVGFGSGVYGGRPHKSIDKFVFGLPRFRGRKAFVFSTSWRGKLSYNKYLKNKLTDKGFDVAGDFSCKGFNCFGPFKLIGGLNKGRPNKEDIEKAVDFARKLKSQATQ
ncbi:MAG: flavodoxin [Candidatus Nanohalarchaeota archaeon]|nr:MAG: flavodoxin [Candidatus Nanohaloarchaeota archaeon]